MKYFRAFWPLIVNVIALCTYVASVKIFYLGKSNMFLLILYLSCFVGCAFIFPGLAIIQTIYSFYLRFKLVKNIWWLHLSTAIGLGICFVIFMLLVDKGYVMTV
jgi:hypothetical protein